MFTTIITFLKANQYYFIIGVVAALIGWHFLAIKLAVNKNNAEWVQRIKDAPVKTDTVTIVHFIPQPNIGGSGSGTSKKNPAIDSLIAVCANKDSVIQSLGSTKSAVFNVDSLGKLTLGYDPLPNLFTWDLTDRPAVPVKTITVTNEKMILVPFRTLGISVDLNPAGPTYAGLKYRVSDFWVVGASYQILGNNASANWINRLRLGIDYYVY